MHLLHFIDVNGYIVPLVPAVPHGDHDQAVQFAHIPDPHPQPYPDHGFAHAQLDNHSNKVVAAPDAFCAPQGVHLPLKSNVQLVKLASHFIFI